MPARSRTERNRSIEDIGGAGDATELAGCARTLIVERFDLHLIRSQQPRHARLPRLTGASPAEVAVPQPVLAEIAFGIERLPRSKRRTDLQARFDLIASELRRAEWTDAVSRTFGRIKAVLERRGTRIEDFDAAIAAHALAVDGTLVTANVGHMPPVPGLRVEDWTD